MSIAIPKEIKVREERAALLLRHVAELAPVGHAVFVENGAGALPDADDDYRARGAVVFPEPVRPGRPEHGAWIVRPAAHGGRRWRGVAVALDQR